jgi:hypothetical protein
MHFLQRAADGLQDQRHGQGDFLVPVLRTAGEVGRTDGVPDLQEPVVLHGTAEEALRQDPALVRRVFSDQGEKVFVGWRWRHGSQRYGGRRLRADEDDRRQASGKSGAHDADVR